MTLPVSQQEPFIRIYVYNRGICWIHIRREHGGAIKQYTLRRHQIRQHITKNKRNRPLNWAVSFAVGWWLTGAPTITVEDRRDDDTIITTINEESFAQQLTSWTYVLGGIIYGFSWQGLFDRLPYIQGKRGNERARVQKRIADLALAHPDDMRSAGSLKTFLEQHW